MADEEQQVDKHALEQLREMVGELSEDDHFMFMVQTAGDAENGATYQAFTTGEHALVMNSAVVALTIAGKDLMVAAGESPDEENAESRAFFYGLQALSKTASEWAESIRARAQGEEEQDPKHVRETVEDSAAAGDTPPPRTTSGGNSVH